MGNMQGRDVRNGVEYSLADQTARFKRAKDEKNARYLDITTVYDGSGLKGQRILVTGGEQGLGLETLKEIVKNGGTGICACRASSKDLDALASQSNGAIQVITGIDVTKTETMDKLCKETKEPIDMVINNAGYFYGPEEKIGVEGRGEHHLNFPQQLLQIDVCALGPLRISSALYRAGLLKRNGKPGKIIVITSQAGSCEWRLTQNAVAPAGGNFVGNYGHHMSRAATNNMAVIMSQEMRPAGICVQLMHPGFNRTTMTDKYKHIWDIEGAVEPHVGAKRVLYESMRASMDTTGTCINCEDGVRQPSHPRPRRRTPRRASDPHSDAAALNPATCARAAAHPVVSKVARPRRDKPSTVALVRRFSL